MRENYRKVPKPGAPVCIAGAIASVSLSAAALAQEAEPPIGIGTLPRDLSPWGMYLNADPVVKAVLIGLAFASIVTSQTRSPESPGSSATRS